MHYNHIRKLLKQNVTLWTAILPKRICYKVLLLSKEVTQAIRSIMELVIIILKLHIQISAPLLLRNHM